MSIHVENISKLYGAQKALREISFEIKKGEIVGFLGPNGAGKSTLMKILTGYITPTEGVAKICDSNITESPIEVKRKIGYLPENNPLYLDMYVAEYLNFTADIYGLKREQVESVIKKTGLTNERYKKIDTLSKGYRQRVGLAQALIHDPEVLILDEPSTGLDPNQLLEIRNLIKKIGQKKTVMLSTHIMQEVEAICNRVIIINKGKIVADKPIEDLQNAKDKNKIITVEFDQDIAVDKLMSLQNTREVVKLVGHKYQIISESRFDLRPEIFQFAVTHKITVLQMKTEEENLETIFHNLTK